MTDIDIDDQGRPEPPLAADEASALIGFLEYQRATLEWKTSGLGAEDMRRTVGASTMTLAGLVKHMAYVEHDWFSRTLFDRPRGAPWDAVDWTVDPDWEWHSATSDDPAAVTALWRSAVTDARADIAAALAEGGMDRLADRRFPDGRAPNLRWIVVHMVEEYARHNGHADLIREAVDGLVGE